MNIWFTGDTHYWHKNISGPKVSVWKHGYRNFENEKEMSRHIVKVFNKYVKENDILYHVGDWSFGGIDNIYNFRKQLICNNIHLCLGNHDQHIKENKIINAFIQDYDDNSRPIIVDWLESKSDFDEQCTTQDLFSSVQDILDIKHGQHSFFLSHYKHAIWNGSHKGKIHLYGHSHGSAEDWIIGKSMDVGIDNAYKLLKEYRPFSIEEVINFMDRRDINFSDHHNKLTNI